MLRDLVIAFVQAAVIVAAIVVGIGYLVPMLR